MPGTAQFELHRKLTNSTSLGADYAYELHTERGVVASGETMGRLLAKPATFWSVSGGFDIRPASRLPKRWTVTRSSGSVLATFDLARLGRGKTAIEVDGARWVFSPIDPALLDTLKAAVLIATDSFVLTDSDTGVLAVTENPSGPVSVVGFARAVATRLAGRPARFSAVARLSVVDPEWAPDPAFVMALLVYKDRVVDPTRAP
jgi:hypothetical protein